MSSLDPQGLDATKIAGSTFSASSRPIDVHQGVAVISRRHENTSWFCREKLILFIQLLKILGNEREEWLYPGNWTFAVILTIQSNDGNQTKQFAKLQIFA